MTKKIPCEVFSRIVGYYRPLHNWNNGKSEEHKDRTFFNALPNAKNETVLCEAPEPVEVKTI